MGLNKDSAKNAHFTNNNGSFVLIGKRKDTHGSFVLGQGISISNSGQGEGIFGKRIKIRKSTTNQGQSLNHKDAHVVFWEIGERKAMQWIRDRRWQISEGKLLVSVTAEGKCSVLGRTQCMVYSVYWTPKERAFFLLEWFLRYTVCLLSWLDHA